MAEVFHVWYKGGTLGSAIVVTELELYRVAVQMLLTAVLIDVLHTALEDAEVSLDSVRVNRSATVLALAVRWEVVIGELTSEMCVLAGFVRVDDGLLRKVFAKDRQKSSRLEVIHNNALGATGVVSRRWWKNEGGVISG